jgi:hypothetical protein
MNFNIPDIIHEMPTVAYWESVYPDNRFRARLVYLHAKKVYWRTVLSERQNHRCCYCNNKMLEHQGSKLSATIDHVIPKSKGGISHHDNYVIACYRCNHARGNQDAFIFAEKMSKGIAQDCIGSLIINESAIIEKINLRQKLKDVGIKVNGASKLCRLRRNLEKYKIKQMISNNIPNNFELNSREYKLYERYKTANVCNFDKITN